MTTPDPLTELESKAKAAARNPYLGVIAVETAAILALIRRVREGERLINAVRPTMDGVYCDDIDGIDWFKAQNAFLAANKDTP